MNHISRQTVILLVLAVVFFAPGLAAVYFYQHPQLLGGHSTNKGAFLEPPFLVPLLQKKPTSTKLTESMPKWYLVLWFPDTCDQTCMSHVEKLARVRLALGRRYYEVSEVLLRSESSPPLSTQLQAKLQQQRIRVLHLSSDASAALSSQSRGQPIFIANPEGFLVLSYAVTSESDDIYHDLKQLLTTTQTKSK